MGVHLTVMGSSPAWPNPGSAHSGYLVEGDGSLLLDCGPGVLARLRERENSAIDAIAITHFHLDHWGDLVPWAWLSAYGVDASQTRPEVWVPPDGVEELHRFASLWGNSGMFERAFHLREYEPETPFQAAGFAVAAIPVAHYDLDAYGFRVSSGGKTLAYSGDSGPCRPLADLARGADLFVCEATLGSAETDGPPRGHLTAHEALAAADGPIVLTHRPIELPRPEGIPLAYDGFTLQM
jgi:ribonuclease BN (tRNA processing enzyme)